MTKALLFDLDDTLAESKQKVSPKIAEQFAKLLTIMPVGIVSGAKPEQIKEQFVAGLPENVNLSNLYLFPEGAAECYSWNTSDFIVEYSFTFSDSEAKEVIDAITSVLEETKLLENEPSFGERIENRHGQITLSALGQQAPLDLKHAWDKDQVKRKLLQEKLITLLPKYEVKIGGGTSIDISKDGIDKTLSVMWLAKKLGIEISELTYVGDALFEGGNDAVVKKTGVPTIQTTGPEETFSIIETFLH